MHANRTVQTPLVHLYIRTLPLHQKIHQQVNTSDFRLQSSLPVSYLELFESNFEVPELANSQASLEEEEGNRRVVSALYKALSSKDFDEVPRLLAPDLEWWFHGPPNRQHLMHLLTGSSSPSSPKDSFNFVPQSIFAFGSTVLVEGYDKERSVSWVHAWTVADGIIIQLREYFNTSLTVTLFGSQPISSPAVASSSQSANKCQSVWQSQLSDKSVPGLVLAL